MTALGRPKIAFAEALASAQSLDPWNAKGVQRDLCCMALLLSERTEYCWKTDQFHFLLALRVLFRDLPDVSAASDLLTCMLAAYVACRDNKLQQCAEIVKTIANRTNECYKDGPSVASLTGQLRLHYALEVDTDSFKQQVSQLLLHIHDWRINYDHYGMTALLMNVVLGTRTCRSDLSLANTSPKPMTRLSLNPTFALYKPRATQEPLQSFLRRAGGRRLA